jgi:hypothetical protein
VLPAIQARLLVEERSTKTQVLPPRSRGVEFCHDSGVGHLAPRCSPPVIWGELTWQVPVELVDAVLAETKTTQRRLRDLRRGWGVLRARVVPVPALGYRKVWANLTATLRRRKSPSAKAFRALRRRLGAAPVTALFEVLAGPVAAPRTPGVRFGRYRTVAFDGCVSVKGPDTVRNRSWLGKQRPRSGSPAIR